MIVGAAVLVLLLVAVAAIWIWWDERTPSYDVTDHERRYDDSVLLMYQVDKDELTSIAAQRGIVPHPAWVEQGEATENSAEVGGAKGLLGKVGRRRTTDRRAHIEMPTDVATLVTAVLTKLELHELNEHVGQAPAGGSEQHPVLSDPDGTADYLREKLAEWYPDGVDESSDEMTERIAYALQAQALEEGVRFKRMTLEDVAQDAFVVIESEWAVQGGGGSLFLQLEQWEHPPYQEREPILTVSSGAGIRVNLDEATLTGRGTANLAAGEKLRLGVFGTKARYDAQAGVLHVRPLAIFSRAGR